MISHEYLIIIFQILKWIFIRKPTPLKIKTMENFYTAYTKVLENKTYYFVKKYLIFPEFKDLSPVLESYGMHSDFNKACSIAGIFDSGIKQQLLNEAQATIQQAKVIDFNTGNFSGKSATS